MIRPNDTHATRIRSDNDRGGRTTSRYAAYRHEDPGLVAEMPRIARQDREQANQTTKEHES
ncbi:hypothetical protein [Bifidobacterium sp. SO4]|uniref:hypothetical protein n=1 Tax=Bifidobacterium sp. SO4 TaxID=2809030 RepID=UPI001BDD003A|nr:hypothetical protein [Bifidobacterium sp. SO4]MBT1171726.1 hypothetical protein [Bifidobacterium sp. SO4]